MASHIPFDAEPNKPPGLQDKAIWARVVGPWTWDPPSSELKLHRIASHLQPSLPPSAEGKHPSVGAAGAMPVVHARFALCSNFFLCPHCVPPPCVHRLTPQFGQGLGAKSSLKGGASFGSARYPSGAVSASHSTVQPRMRTYGTVRANPQKTHDAGERCGVVRLHNNAALDRRRKTRLTRDLLVIPFVTSSSLISTPPATPWHRRGNPDLQVPCG
ncbi:hypothetical protein B0J13DRAFT_37727 [Dactylonectria estremocensis]|uniref:Uncharacterized protein n=1 Tax=Dactylonectria estremocensis TaxID=1079267 RepID=A0A9P9JJB5_9HYPO|nr:hypothetical protein B0J13DRAFT_37727 [Dactylonectria estremocensis]